MCLCFILSYYVRYQRIASSHNAELLILLNNPAAKVLLFF